MKKIERKGKTFFQFEQLNDPQVFHFTSTKLGWGGKTRFTGDRLEEYQKWRGVLANALELPLDQLIFPRQVHGNHVELITEYPQTEDIPETDALITNVPGICICVQSADCVPVLLYDPAQKVVAAIHAGWRGTVSKIVTETILKMKSQFSTKPEHIIAAIGPSISRKHYEVGLDVINRVKNTLSNSAEVLYAVNSEKACLDLWKANEKLLLKEGVLPANIEVAGYCSYSETDWFYSARRDGAATGRMISGIQLT